MLKFEVARPCWYGAMLTSCPNCQHVFELVPCCNQSRALAAMAGGGLISVPSPLSMALQANESSSKATTSSPQPSPSAPLSFTWSLGSWSPPTAAAPQTSHSDADLARLGAAVQTLRTSGWYYEGLTWQQSAELLRDSEPGTFLVRDSSDPRFLFSLSVQTERGPTSVRLHYVHGFFRLDAEARLASVMPVFDCIVRLVQHYVNVTKNRASGGVTPDKEQVWVDATGHMYSHILLTKPLYKRGCPPSLQHMARLVINQTVGTQRLRVEKLQLPQCLKMYLKEYPYCH